MDNFWENVSVYLPPYLSETSKNKLFEDLDKFNNRIDCGQELYSKALKTAPFLMQGDGIDQMYYVNLPSCDIKNVRAIICSNTCDISLDNLKTRKNPARIMYAPILSFAKYRNLLLTKFKEEQIHSHLVEIKKQHVTQILFLPMGDGLPEDSIVFLDRMISLPLKEDLVHHAIDHRIFTLSDTGFYLFLIKLSIHFTRVQEKIDRFAGIDVGAKK